MSSLAALGALYYTGQQSGATQAQIVQAEQGQVTSRYTAAVEQLGSDALEVRLGGIYALERLARDSPRDQSTVTEVLSAYLRSKLPGAGTPDCLTRPVRVVNDNFPPPPASIPSRPSLAGDLAAALTVLGRRDDTIESVAPDLRNVCLRGLLLPIDLDLSDADLSFADLSGSEALQLDLTGAQLQRANFARASIAASDFSRARLLFTDLSDTQLDVMLFRGTRFLGSNLSRADIDLSDFTGAIFEGANVTDTEFRGQSYAFKGPPPARPPDALDLRGSRGRPALVVPR